MVNHLKCLSQRTGGQLLGAYTGSSFLSDSALFAPLPPDRTIFCLKILAGSERVVHCEYMKRLAFTLLLAGSTHLSRAAVPIDSFDVGDITLTTSGSTTQEGLDTAFVATGRRTISAGADPFEARVNTTASEFRFSSTFGWI